MIGRKFQLSQLFSYLVNTVINFTIPFRSYLYVMSTLSRFSHSFHCSKPSAHICIVLFIFYASPFFSVLYSLYSWVFFYNFLPRSFIPVLFYFPPRPFSLLLFCTSCNLVSIYFVFLVFFLFYLATIRCSIPILPIRSGDSDRKMKTMCYSMACLETLNVIISKTEMVAWQPNVRTLSKDDWSNFSGELMISNDLLHREFRIFR